MNRRSTVIVLGDGRGNGNDAEHGGVRRDHPPRPGDDLADARSRATRGAWARCDLPRYAEYCDRIRVVRDLTGLSEVSHDMAAEMIGR